MDQAWISRAHTGSETSEIIYSFHSKILIWQWLQDLIPFIEDDEDGAATGGGESEEMAMDIDNKSDTYRAVLAEHKQLDEV